MPRCPNCATRLVRLAPQRGIADRLLGLLTIYPNCCQLCGHRFLRFRGRFRSLPKRDYHRVPVHFPTWYRSVFRKDDRDGLQGTMVNLSIGGCHIKGHLRIPKGSRIRLQFEVSDDRAPLTVEEAIVHFNPNNGIGLRFTKIGPLEKRRLAQIIRERLAHRWIMRRGPTGPSSSPPPPPDSRVPPGFRGYPGSLN